MKEILTLGSLFDGAGGFPYAGMLAGIVPIWASEIEPFPIRVTTRRFPNMKHLGNIKDINGAEVAPVDIITFGSPCQDLSVAGNRSGLKGERSGLFKEAIRIIREMREKTNGRKPTYIVWENVPGAFSSNKGEDFRIVLEEIAKIKDVRGGRLSIPRPNKGKWKPAGEVLGDGYSIAWRTYDAQYWGVPQRRKRIYLVADFGGHSAGQIQFKSDRLLRNPTQSRTERKRTAGASEDNPSQPTAGGVKAKVYENHANDSRIKELGKVGETVTTRYGTGGNNTPIVVQERTPTVYSLSSKGSEAWLSDNPHSGCHEVEVTRTLDTNGGNPNCAQGGNIVIQPKPYTVGNGQVDGATHLDPLCKTLNCMHDPMIVLIPQEKPAYGIDRAAFNQGKNARYNFSIEEELEPCLVAKGPNAVAVPQDSDQYPYIARRLMPIECCRLQGYPDYWTKDIATPEPTETEIDWWQKAFEAHRKATNPNGKPKTRNQIRKWLQSPQTDSAEYKMWGNSLAIPCAYTVLAGIAEVLTKCKGVGRQRMEQNGQETPSPGSRGERNDGGEYMDEITMMPTRRCKRCGRLLFSSDALRTGYGCQCAKKAKKEDMEKRPDPNQITLFNLETKKESEVKE